MTRELKFRVWDGEKFLRSSFGKKDAEFISLKIEGGILPQYGGLMNYHKTMVVQQYTGLKDKNGKEIYEGDIVKYKRCRTKSVELTYNVFESVLEEGPEEVGEIIYITPMYCISFECKRYDDIEELSKATHRLEVIGNIFENPELLE